MARTIAPFHVLNVLRADCGVAQAMERLAKDNREELQRVRDKAAQEEAAARRDTAAVRQEVERYKAMLDEQKGSTAVKLQDFAKELSAAATADKEVLEHRRRKEVELLRQEKEDEKARAVEEVEGLIAQIKRLEQQVAERDQELEKSAKIVGFMEDAEATLKNRLRAAEQRTVEIQGESDEANRKLRQEVLDPPSPVPRLFRHHMSKCGRGR